MIESTIALAALIPLAGYAGFRIGKNDGRVLSNMEREEIRSVAWIDGYRDACANEQKSRAEHPNAADYRNRLDRAEAELREVLAAHEARRTA